MENFATNHFRTALSKQIFFSWVISYHHPDQLCKSAFYSLAKSVMYTHSAVEGRGTDQGSLGVPVAGVDVEAGGEAGVGMTTDADAIGRTITIAAIIDGHHRLAPMRNAGGVCFLFSAISR